MTRFPAVEAAILRDLNERGEARPPQGRLAEEYFWQAASRLQAQGLCRVDQMAGVVRKPGTFSLHELRPDPELLAVIAHYPFRPDGMSVERFKELTEESREAIPRTDLPARLRLLLQRWRQKPEGSAYLRAAIDLEEVLEECGVKP